MKDFILYFLLLVILGEVVTLYLKNPQKPQEKVLAVATVLTPSPTPEITASPSPSPLPTITPTPIPTPSPLPPGEINVLIDRFSSQYSVDPNVMRHIAICESGFNPNAKKLSYVGLFQFGPATWQNIRKEIGEDTNINLRYSVEESVQTAAYSLSKGKRGIWPNCAP